MDDGYGAASCTSPRARRLRAVTVCACLLALTSAASGTASPARHRPPHHRGNVSSATPFPYFAPWQTGFTRYSTQVVTPKTSNLGTSHFATLDVPDGQFWRLISWTLSFATDATVRTRTLVFTVAPIGGSAVFTSGFPAAMTASQTAALTVSPQVATFANTTSSATAQNLEVPDVLWQPGMEFVVQMNSGVAGDQVVPGTTFALVEVYTEDYVPAVAPAVVTTPLML